MKWIKAIIILLTYSIQCAVCWLHHKFDWFYKAKHFCFASCIYHCEIPLHYVLYNNTTMATTTTTRNLWLEFWIGSASKWMNYLFICVWIYHYLIVHTNIITLYMGCGNKTNILINERQNDKRANNMLLFYFQMDA